MTVKGLHNTVYNLDAAPIGSGGEGNIHNVRGMGFVAKIYKPGVITTALENKLKTMITHPPNASVLSQVAWPLDMAYDENGTCQGFVMPKLSINAELGEVYKYPSTLPLSLQQKINVAQNICVVISEVHKAGYVFGDFNPRNIGLDVNTGLVSFLDTDTYHVEDRERDAVYRCNVCAPGYAAPELLEKVADFVSANPTASQAAYAQTPLPTFTPQTDNFALAIHIFKLLMNGYTPFGGIIETASVSQSSPGLGDAAVRRNSYCFRPGYKPQSVAIPELNTLPEEIGELFTRAFIVGKSYPAGRPDAVEWHAALERFTQQLVTCTANPLHQYDKRNIVCPLCEADKRFIEVLSGSGSAASVSANKPTLTQTVFTPATAPVAAPLRPPVITPLTSPANPTPPPVSHVSPYAASAYAANTPTAPSASAPSASVPSAVLVMPGWAVAWLAVISLVVVIGSIGYGFMFAVPIWHNLIISYVNELTWLIYNNRIFSFDMFFLLNFTFMIFLLLYLVYNVVFGIIILFNLKNTHHVNRLYKLCIASLVSYVLFFIGPFIGIGVFTIIYMGIFPVLYLVVLQVLAKLRKINASLSPGYTLLLVAPVSIKKIIFVVLGAAAAVVVIAVVVMSVMSVRAFDRVSPRQQRHVSMIPYAAVGDIVQFGVHDWRVLDIQDGYALLLTDRLLEERAFFNDWEEVSWAASDIRAWLNGGFLETFSPADRGRIRSSFIISQPNPWNGFHRGLNTHDYVFLLSIEEVVRYFGDSGILGSDVYHSMDWHGIIDDQYNYNRQAFYDDGVAHWWSLRCSGRWDSDIAGVTPDGTISILGKHAQMETHIRPAMWVYLGYRSPDDAWEEEDAAPDPDPAPPIATPDPDPAPPTAAPDPDPAPPIAAPDPDPAPPIAAPDPAPVPAQNVDARYLDNLALAMQNDTNAQIRLGSQYRWGDGVEEDLVQARYWFERAAALGNSGAMLQIASMYIVAQNPTQQVYWLRRAATLDNHSAVQQLAMAYMGGRGVTQDREHAVYLLHRAIDLGNITALMNLGDAYNAGNGVTRDQERAVYWFRRAEAQGNVNANLRLGSAYRRGWGVEQNHEQAVYWFRRGAAMDNAASMMELGEMYAWGDGVAQNSVQAIYWINSALEREPWRDTYRTIDMQTRVNNRIVPGSIDISHTQARPGTLVTVTVSENEDFRFTSFTGGTNIRWIRDPYNHNTATFIMLGTTVRGYLSFTLRDWNIPGTGSYRFDLIQGEWIE